MRRISRLFRALRGPWHTCKFGKIILEARQHLVREVAAGNEAACALVDLYLPPICRDLSIDPGIGTRAHVLDILKRKGGKVVGENATRFCDHVLWSMTMTFVLPSNVDAA